MGSFVADLSRMASEGLDKLKTSPVGKVGIDYGASIEHERMKTPQGQSISKLMMIYQKTQAEALGQLDVHHSTLVKGIERDSSLRNTLDIGNTKLGQITDHLKKLQHPLASVAQNLENQTPENYDKTLKEIGMVNRGQARLAGIAAGPGDKMQNVLPLIQQLQDHEDPRMDTHAQRLLDGISNQLKDTALAPDPMGGLHEASKSKVDIAEGLKNVNKFRQVAREAGSDVPLLRPNAIRTDPTYTKAGEVEKKVGAWTRMVQVPLVAIPHIGTYFNLGTAPVQALGRALFSMNNEELNAHIFASGALSATMHDIMHSYIEGRTGLVSKVPFVGKSAGQMLYSTVHTPGFNYLREKQLWFGAAVGYHSAIDWAAKAVKGDKRALLELKEMGLDTAEVLKQGGQLTDEQLQQGIYHFTNNRFFVNRLQDQTLKSNSNVFMRSATMYHQFLNSQVSFMGREFEKMRKSGDIMGMAQLAGTFGILFPSVAPALKSLEILGRTGSTTQAKESLDEDYSNLSGNAGPAAFAKEYGELLLHIGGMGVFTNYIEAAGNHRLQSAMLGPLFSTPASLAEDLITSAHESKKGTHNIKPALRDIAQDTLPVIGKPLSHWIAPTNKEEPKVRLPRRGRRRF
jgi:hypothetical protein